MDVKRLREEFSVGLFYNEQPVLPEGNGVIITPAGGSLQIEITSPVTGIAVPYLYGRRLIWQTRNDPMIIGFLVIPGAITRISAWFNYGVSTGQPPEPIGLLAGERPRHDGTMRQVQKSNGHLRVKYFPKTSAGWVGIGFVLDRIEVIAAPLVHFVSAFPAVTRVERLVCPESVQEFGSLAEYETGSYAQ